MDSKKVNKILNYIIVFLLCIMFISLVLKIFEPLKYNKNTKTNISKFEQSPYIYSALDKYIYAIRRENEKYINKLLPMVRRKNIEKYSAYAKYLDENFNKINITSISYINYDMVLVKYTINQTVENTVIMKIYENTDYFKVYFDEKLENIL